MTYWLVGEEPWRTRRSRLSLVVPEIPTVNHSSTHPGEESVALDIPLNFENSSPEMDPVDTSPNTWLLSDCPIISDSHHSPEYESKITQLINDEVDMNFGDRNHCPVNNYNSSKSQLRQQLTRGRSCKSCQSQENNGTKRLISTRYCSAPIIATNGTFHRDSSPTIPLCTTNPKSCV